MVILSHNFFRKRWPRWELDGLTARQLAGEENVILPVLHEVGRDDVRSYSPPLADLFAVRSSDGVEAVADGVVRVLERRITGGETKASLDEARKPSTLSFSSWRRLRPSSTTRPGALAIAAVSITAVALAAVVALPGALNERPRDQAQPAGCRFQITAPKEGLRPSM